MPAALEAPEPGGLFDHRAPLLGLRAEDRLDLALADDRVHPAAEPEVGEDLDEVDPAHRSAVDEVLALTAAVEAAHGRGVQVVVVGGGTAGVELALAAQARLCGFGREEGAVTLVETMPRILPERPSAAGAAERALTRNRVRVRAGVAARAATATALLLADGSTVPADVLIWATGAGSTDLLRSSGLVTDGQGFVLVKDTLNSVSDPLVFAAGDAATLETYPATPKAGVYAVREGAVLSHNLAVACRGDGPLRRYVPQPRFLTLLNTGDGRAILSYGPLTLTARWVMTLKDWIDRRFVARFRSISVRTAGQ